MAAAKRARDILRAAMTSLAGIEPKRIQASLLQALHWLRMKWPNRKGYRFDLLMGRFVVLIQPALSADEQAQFAKELCQRYGGVTDQDDEWPDVACIHAALWLFVSQGLIYPRLRRVATDGYPTVIEFVIPTPAGIRVLDQPAHPLQPEFLVRLRKSWPAIPDEVTARFEDAAECLARGLIRAAVVMVGLATELVIQEAHVRVVTSGKASKHSTMRDRLSDLLHAANGISKPEDQHVLRAALAALEVIRTARNQASHPGAAFDNPAEAEELIVLSSHHLPVVWKLWVEGGSS